jgi:outer membrane protein assembly factor BamB
MGEDRAVTDLDERPDELQRYVRSMRRQRAWYLIAVAAVAVVALTVTLVVWFTGEITHVRVRTAASAPPSVPLATPPATPALSWRSSDATAIGAPFFGGTVVTYSEHTVTGRNALTGVADWTYTRTDRTLCQVVQLGGKTIAIYADSGNCDEVSAVDTGTGQRAWTRTLDENGLTVSGHPSIIAGTDTMYVWSSAFVYAIDPVSGYDRWTYPITAGCTLTSVVPGSAGVLMSAHCADGDQLLMRDRAAGVDDKQQTDDKKNHILWRVKKTNTVPVAADSIVAALDPATRQLVTYDPAKGTVTGHVTLRPAPAMTSPILRTAAQQEELVWIAGTAYALTSSGTQEWSASLQTLPTVSAPDGSPTAPALGAAVILVATSSGVAQLDGATGTITKQYPVPPPRASSQAFPVGAGILVAGSATAYYE